MEGEGIPKGGFVFVSATGLLATWWSYKAGLIEFRDVRVWLACHEAKARRCKLEKGRLPRFTASELGKIVGAVTCARVRASLRRLGVASLLAWSESAIECRASKDGLSSEAVQFIERVTNHRRRIPVPRPLLLALAREQKPVSLATTLGHLLRCMYFRNGSCAPRGLCKASWIAETFSVDERNVKAARKALETEIDGRPGVLIRERTSQRVLNRFGVAIRFNLDWEPIRKSPPRKALSTRQSPPLRETGISSSRRSGNCKLESPSPVGVRKRTGRGPNIRRLTELDLKEPRRTLELHRQAAAMGLVSGSEADRLKVLALASHALRHAKRNACGLFVSVLREGHWHRISLRDEDCARGALGTLHDERETELRPVSRQKEIEDDACAVRSLIARSLASVEEGDFDR